MWLTFPKSALGNCIWYNWLWSVLATSVSSDGLMARHDIICCCAFVAYELKLSCGIYRGKDEKTCYKSYKLQ
jgi:hypothetical protein